MKRWSTKYLALLCLGACDDGVSFDALDAGAHGGHAASTTDVLVVHFEVDGADGAPARPGAEAAADEAAEAARAARALAVAQAATNGLVAAAEALEASAAASRQAALLAMPAHFLVEGGQLVLAQGEAATALAAGEPQLDGGGDGDSLFVARRVVVAETLPAELTQLIGQEVKVYDREREVCVARIGTPELVAKLVHFPDEWSEDEKPPAPEHDAADVFAQGVTALEAKLEPLMGNCDGGLWAAPLAAPEPTLYREAALSPKLKRQAIAAFRALPLWREAQAEMERAIAEQWDAAEQRRVRGQRWDTFEGATPEVVLYRAAGGAREIAVVYANSNDGCGSVGQQAVSLLEVVRGADGKVRLLEIDSVMWAEMPSGLVDMEGDGALEIFANAFGRDSGLSTVIERWHGERPAPSEANDWTDERFEQVESFQVPDLTFWGCGC